MRYIKTDNGRDELQAHRHALTPYQRKILILCDGNRHAEDLVKMMPQDDAQAHIAQLCSLNLLKPEVSATDSRPPAAQAVVNAAPSATAAPMTDAERYHEMMALSTSLAGNLGFASRVKAQLQIERADTVHDLMGVVNLLAEQLNDKQKGTPQITQQLTRLRQLAAG